MQEHSGRYEEAAAFFVQQGLAVLTYDHIGHGCTAKSPTEHGFFLKKRGAEQLVEDVGLLSNHLKELYPGCPHFILGHSMGSFITRAFLQESSGDFQGTVIVGTGGKIPGIGLAKAFLRLLKF